MTTEGDHQREYWERGRVPNVRPPTHPVIEAYVLPKIREIRRHITLSDDTSLLEVGCGNGAFTVHLERICDAQGVDYSKRMLRMNPARSKSIGDVNGLGFRDGEFDVVFCHQVLHHVSDADKAVREMSRVSKRYVIMLEPNRNNPLMFLFLLLVREERRGLKFSLDYLRLLATRNGLRPVASFSWGLMVPNKTPNFLLPLLRLFEFRQPLGMTHFVIAERVR
jgi:SAM-dependent methyltransferase